MESFQLMLMTQSNQQRRVKSSHLLDLSQKTGDNFIGLELYLNVLTLSLQALEAVSLQVTTMCKWYFRIKNEFCN